MEIDLAQKELITPKESDRLNKPLGSILLEAGLVSAIQIEIALQQQKDNYLRIGEIFASHDWIKQETADFFAEDWSFLVAQRQKKPLVYYFKRSGLLSEQQIQQILAIKKNKPKKVRFHHLVLEKGYLKAETVEFFLAHIFNIYNEHKCSFSGIYDILKSYNDGLKDFTQIELIKAPLMGISLKEVQLNGSNLMDSNFQGCNLSDSSLIQVNLASANFVKSILSRVNFERAYLVGANLQEAHLEKANFKSANLKDADLRDAYLFKTCFAGADLRGAKLSSRYDYEVYYDLDTVFDYGFDPMSVGWKMREYQYSC